MDKVTWSERLYSKTMHSFPKVNRNTTAAASADKMQELHAIFSTSLIKSALNRSRPTKEMWQKIQHRKYSTSKFLNPQHSIEGPFAMVLHDLFEDELPITLRQYWLIFSDPLFDISVHTLILAIIKCIPCCPTKYWLKFFGLIEIIAFLDTADITRITITSRCIT